MFCSSVFLIFAFSYSSLLAFFIEVLFSRTSVGSETLDDSPKESTIEQKWSGSFSSNSSLSESDFVRPGSGVVDTYSSLPHFEFS